MLLPEAHWLNENIKKYVTPADGPALNLGSSTLHYRAKLQPFIEELVIKPLEEIIGQPVVHSDAKNDPGVDMVGDILDPVFQVTIQEKKFGVIVCANLLEQVSDAQAAMAAIAALPRPGGLLFITAPHVFPYHPDPVDNLFRPAPSELANYVNMHGYQVLDQALVVGQKRYFQYLLPHPFQLVKQLRFLPHYVKKVQISCIIAKKS